jgi:hypothetical protein
MKDLFEEYDKQPRELRAITNKWEARAANGLTYEQCFKFWEQVNAVGYTFDYYLDATPYGLRPAHLPLCMLEGFEQEMDESPF